MDSAVATVSAATMGAAIAVVGLVANKENKTSEFRQEWINALRDDIASLVGVLYVIEGGAPDANKASEIVNTLNVRIHLRFKNNDPDSAAFRRALLVLMDPDTMTLHSPNFKRALDLLVHEAQKLLRAEWLVVKRGERIYRCLVGVLAALLILTATLTLVHFRTSLIWALTTPR